MAYLKRLRIQLAQVLFIVISVLFLFSSANTKSLSQNSPGTPFKDSAFGSPKTKSNLHSRSNTPIRLVSIRAGRHEEYGSVVFQFSKRYRYTILKIKNQEIRFNLMNTGTHLKPYRKYKTFNSWVKLNTKKNRVYVSIGLPKHFEKHVVIPLSNPYRLVVNLYIRKQETQDSPQKTVPSQKTVTPTAPKSADAKPPVSQTLSAADIRQIDLITARIYSRKGLYEKSIRLYEQLRQRYPDDEEIWEEYIEILVNFSHYEQAISEIGKLKRKNPSTLRGQRIQARIYQELRRHRWTIPIYEGILSQNRNDVGIWSDYAYIRQDVGHWADALNYFSRVLELDPENRSALRGVHEILKEHRPNLQAGYDFNVQESGDARVQTIPFRYSRHITQQSRLDLNYSRIEIDRSADTGIVEIDQIVDDAYLILHHQFNSKWEGSFGVGGYEGMGGGTSFFLGAGYSPWINAFIRAAYVRKRPWFDPVDAADFDGSYNRLNASFDWSIDETWGIFLGGEQWDYFVDDDRDYGKKSNFTGIITKRLWSRPDLFLSYAFYYSHFNYEDENFRPIDMIPTEVVHSFSGNFEHWPCKYWAIVFSGGRRWDVERSINSWYALPGIKVRFGNRIESDISYEYSSEAGTAAGGKTGTLRVSTKFIF